MIPVEEEMLQLNNMFKLLISLLREYSVTLSEKQQMENDDWFDLSDEEVFAFKKKINLGLRKTKDHVQDQKEVILRDHRKKVSNPT